MFEVTPWPLPLNIFFDTLSDADARFHCFHAAADFAMALATPCWLPYALCAHMFARMRHYARRRARDTAAVPRAEEAARRAAQKERSEDIHDDTEGAVKRECSAMRWRARSMLLATFMPLLDDMLAPLLRSHMLAHAPPCHDAAVITRCCRHDAA